MLRWNNAASFILCMVCSSLLVQHAADVRCSNPFAREQDALYILLCLCMRDVQDGTTPFWIACSRGHMPVVKWLASQPGVDVHKADRVQG